MGYGGTFCKKFPLFRVPLLFLHPKDAAEDRGKEPGGSHEYDLHSRTPFLVFGKYVSGAKQKAHTENAEKGLREYQGAKRPCAKGGHKARGAFRSRFDGIHGSTSFAVSLCTRPPLGSYSATEVRHYVFDQRLDQFS